MFKLSWNERIQSNLYFKKAGIQMKLMAKMNQNFESLKLEQTM